MDELKKYYAQHYILQRGFTGMPSASLAGKVLIGG